jgi:hypothetical protein
MLSDGGSSGPLMLPQAIPAFLAHVDAGRLADLAPTLAPIVAGAQTYCIGYQPKCLPQHRTSAGVLYSVLCHDIAPFHDDEVAAWKASSAPGVSPAYGTSPLLDVCTRWPVAGQAADAVDRPPTGDVPTLVATGRFGPYAPEAVVREGLTGLSHATYAVDPGNGHNVIVSTDCLAVARNTWIDQLALPPSALDCMDDQVPPFVTDLSTVIDSSSGSAAAPSTTSTPPAQDAAQLQGSWLVSLSGDTIAAGLAAGGFADLSDRFFRQEETPADGVRLLLRIQDGRFSGVYNDGLDDKGEWYVGWSGTVTIQGDRIELKDPKDGTTDTLRYQVSGDQLTLAPLQAAPATLDGLPSLAYDYAYLAARPLTRVDCAQVTPPCA